MSATNVIPKVDVNALLPWRWAESMQSCSLFWIPVNLGSIPRSQREWLLEFFARLSAHLAEANGLQAEHFMQMQVIDGDKQLRETFMNSMMKESPLLGRCWLPREKQPVLPSEEDRELMARKKKEYRPFDYVQQQAWWFLSRNAEGLLEHYLGHGGLTAFFHKPDAEELMPPLPVLDQPIIIPKFLRNHPHLKVILEGFDPHQPDRVPGFVRNHPMMKQLYRVLEPDKMQEKSKAMMSPFREQTKEIFGAGLPRNLEYEGILFVLPRLASQDFFAQTDQQIRRWFEVFDVYVTESPEDRGIVMAGKDDLTSVVASIVEKMRSKGYRYWEG
jgi:hypothetical protein